MSPRYNDLNDINASLAAIALRKALQNEINVLCCDTLSGGFLTSIDNYIIDYDIPNVTEGQAETPTYPKQNLAYGPQASPSYKCQASYALTRAVVEIIEVVVKEWEFGSRAANLFAAVTAVAAVPLSPVGYISASLWVISALGSEVATAFDQLATFIEDNEQDLACIFYNASNTTQAQAGFINYIDNNLDRNLLINIDGLLDKEKDWLRQILTNANLAALFFEHPVIDVSEVGTVDCGGCGGGDAVFEINSEGDFGTLISGDFSIGTETVIESTLGNPLSNPSDLRQTICIQSLGDICYEYTFELVTAGGESEVYRSYINCQGTTIQDTWLSFGEAFPFDRQCILQWMIGGYIGGQPVPFRVKIIPYSI